MSSVKVESSNTSFCVNNLVISGRLTGTVLKTAAKGGLVRVVRFTLFVKYLHPHTDGTMHTGTGIFQFSGFGDDVCNVIEDLKEGHGVKLFCYVKQDRYLKYAGTEIGSPAFVVYEATPVDLINLDD